MQKKAKLFLGNSPANPKKGDIWIETSSPEAADYYRQMGEHLGYEIA